MSELPSQAKPLEQPTTTERFFADEDEKKRWQDVVWQRTIDAERHKLFFDHGYCTPEHPAQRYVDDLVTVIKQKPGFPLRVFVAPDWRQANACALPGGTVILSSAAIEMAGTAEGVLGIIAHEYTHVYEEHAKKDESQKRVWTKATSLVERLSRGRAAEYQADIQGALFDLDRAGVNPLGYKAFLEKLAEREIGQTKGWVHGSSLDRALNIASAIHIVDFQSIDAPLTPLPTEVLASLKGRLHVKSHLDIRINPSDRSEVDERKKRREDRRNQIDTLDAEFLPDAVRVMKGQVAERQKQEKPIARDQEHLDLVIKRFDAECLPQGIEEAETRGYVRDVMIALGSGKIAEVVGETRASIDRFKKALAVLADRPELKRLHVYVTDILQTVSEVLYKHKLYTRPDGAVDFSSMKNELKEWVTLAQRVWQSAGIDAVEGVEQFETNAIRSIWYKVDQVQRKELQAVYPDFKPYTLTYTEEEEEALRAHPSFARGEYLYQELDPKKNIQGLLATKQEILSLESAQSLEGVTMAVKAFLRGLDATLPEKRSNGLNHIKTYVLFQECVRDSAWAKDMSKLELNALLTAAIDHLGLHSVFKTFEEKGNKTDLAIYNSNLTPEGEAIFRLILSTFKLKYPDVKPPKGRGYTPDEFEQLYTWLVDPSIYEDRIGITASRPGFTRDYVQSKKEMVADAFIRKLAGSSFDDLVQAIVDLEARCGEMEDEFFTTVQKSGVIAYKLSETLEQRELTQDLRVLLRIGKFIADPFLQRTFHAYIRDQIWSNLSFDQRLALIFPAGNEIGIEDMETMRRFFEEDVRTAEDFEKVKRAMRTSVSQMVAEGSARAGVVAIVSMLGSRSIDKSELIECLLVSEKKDLRLKMFVYDALRGNYSAFTKSKRDDDGDDGTEYYGGEDDESERSTLAPMSKEEMAHIRKEVVQCVRDSERIMRSIYSMDDMGRSVLLRNFLASEGALLQDAFKRKRLYEFLLGEWVGTAGSKDKDLLGLFQDVQGALGEVREWQLMYFVLHGLLVDRIALPPDERGTASWGESYQLVEDLKSGPDDKVDEKEVSKWLNGRINKDLPKTALKDPRRFGKDISAHGDDRLRRVLINRGLVNKSERKQMTPIRFVKEATSKMGAPGVRFLQVLPQFIELNPEYEQEFLDVYDGVKGQSKLAALALLEREWPEVWTVLPTIEDRAGGGSIVSVFKATSAEGEKEVVKVRNPNIQYHLNETFRFARMILNDLAKRKGGSYVASAAALDDIKAWIEGDISFKGFLGKDAAFREKHHGFQPDGFDYKIRVPVSKGPENPYFVREQYVDGKNFTQWEDLVAEGHDMKQVVSLLMKNYVNQILDGQVHSDVHIGNFRVSPDKEVAILDRNFYLDLRDEDKNLIAGFLNPFATREDRTTAIQKALIGDVPQASRLTPLVTNLVDQAQAQNWAGVSKAIVRIKQTGIRVPLTVTLLLKNVNSLQNMAKKAGFKDVVEAFSYQP